MPRFLSAVTTLSSSLPMVFTQTWRTLLVLGAIQARRLPSGEIWGLTRSGLPKRTSRGINGGSSAWAADRARLKSAKARARFAKNRTSRFELLNLPRTRPSAFAKATADESVTLSPAEGERDGVRGRFLVGMRLEIGRASGRERG